MQLVKYKMRERYTLFVYFLYPALLHVAPAQDSVESGEDTDDEEMDSNDGDAFGDTDEAPQPSATHQDDASRRWASIMRAYRSLLVAIRAVAGFKPASAPDVKVGCVICYKMSGRFIARVVSYTTFW